MYFRFYLFRFNINLLLRKINNKYIVIKYIFFLNIFYQQNNSTCNDKFKLIANKKYIYSGR